MLTQKDYVISETFGVGPDMTVPGYAQGHTHQPFVPDADSSYVFRPEILSTLVAWWAEEVSPLYLWGPMGSGKTSGLLQMAAKLNIPVQLVNAHDRLETPELVGRYVLNDQGGMDFVDGPLTTAMRFGHLFIIDEVDLLDPGTAAGLNGLREGMPLTIPETGEVVRPKGGFRMAVTANTNGHGDEFGVYPGTNRLNQAFLDGFIGMEVGYPDKSTEVDLVGNVMPDVDTRIVEAMVDIANDIRDAFIGNPYGQGTNAIEVTMSTRSLIKWARWRMILQNAPKPFTLAMDRSLLWHASADTREFVHGLIQRSFDE